MDVFRAVWEGKEAGLPDSPLGKLFHDRHHETLGDSPIPQIRTDRERAEESHASPVAGDIGPGQLAINRGSKNPCRIGFPASPQNVRVTRKLGVLCDNSLMACQRIRQYHDPMWSR